MANLRDEAYEALKERLEDVERLDDSKRPITEEDKADYLQLIYDGFRQDEAARKLGFTGSRFRRFLRVLGHHYDREFAEAFHEAINSPQHENGRLAWLRGLQDKRAAEGSDRMIEKLSYAEDPKWESLRSANLNLNVTAQIIHRVLPHLSDDELERAIEKAELDRKKPELKALPPPAA